MSFADDDELVPASADVVAIGRPDRHVTLVFLGGVPEGVALEVWRSLPPLRMPDEVRALRWDRFGRSALALELSDDDGLLAAAADPCQNAALQVVEVQRHPVYRPHVTMARVPRRSRPPSGRVLAGWPMPTDPVAVGVPTLYCTPSPAHPTTDRYAVVAVARGGELGR